MLHISLTGGGGGGGGGGGFSPLSPPPKSDPVCSGSYMYIGGGGIARDCQLVCSGSYMYIGGGGTGLRWLLHVYRWWGYWFAVALTCIC